MRKSIGKVAAALGLIASAAVAGNSSMQGRATAGSDGVAVNKTQQGSKAATGNNQQQPVNSNVPISAADRVFTGRARGPMYFPKQGVPPKMWGQYLQRTGRQKWTKSKKCS